MHKLLGATAVSSLLALSTFTPLVAAQDETRRVEGLDFDEIVVLGSAEVEISQGDELSLQLRGPAKYLDSEPFYVKRDTLVLGARKRGGKKDSRLRFRVVMPELRELNVNGSGTVFIKPFEFDTSTRSAPSLAVDGSGEINAFELTGQALEVRVEGSGEFRAVSIEVTELEAVVAGSGDLFIETLKADSGEFVVTGSGDLRVTEEGYVDTLEVNVVGSGDIRMPSVASRRAETNIVGSGAASIGEVTEQLNASILGSGDVVYSGTPSIESVELGSGEVRRRD